MVGKTKLDEKDALILNELQRDAKQTVKELGARVGLTATPTYERIRKLEAGGVIERYSVVLNRKKIGKELLAFCQVSLAEHSKEALDSFKSHAFTLSEVRSCYHVSGGFDFLLKVSVSDMNAFQNFANDKLASIKGIATIHSSFAMSVVVEDLPHFIAST